MAKTPRCRILSVISSKIANIPVTVTYNLHFVLSIDMHKNLRALMVISERDWNVGVNKVGRNHKVVFYKHTLNLVHCTQNLRRKND